MRRCKNYENRSIFSKDMDKSIVCVFWPTLYVMFPGVQLFEAIRLLHLIQLSSSCSLGFLSLSLELQPLLSSVPNGQNTTRRHREFRLPATYVSTG